MKKNLKKVIGFVFPSRGEKTNKWWHRLILVIGLIGAIGITVLATSGAEFYSFPTTNRTISYEIVAGDGWDAQEFFSCFRKDPQSYYPYSYKCPDDEVFTALKSTSWAQEFVASTSPEDDSLETRAEVLSTWETDLIAGGSLDPKSDIIQNLTESDVISARIDYATNWDHVIFLVGVALGSFLGVIVGFFTILYRIFLFIAFGRKKKS